MVKQRRNIIKLKKGSEGYKAGYRYVDIGLSVHKPTKLLTKAPRTRRKKGRKVRRVR